MTEATAAACSLEYSDTSPFCGGSCCLRLRFTGKAPLDGATKTFRWPKKRTFVHTRGVVKPGASSGDARAFGARENW